MVFPALTLPDAPRLIDCPFRVTVELTSPALVSAPLIAAATFDPDGFVNTICNPVTAAELAKLTGYVSADPLLTVMLPVLPPPHPDTPESTKLPLASIDTQWPLVSAPVLVANLVVLPVTDPTVGAEPAPPPITGRLAVRAADDAHADDDEKYGMPPDVPATVSARVPVEVIGEPPTDISPPVKV